VIEPGKAPALAVQPARLDLYMLYAAYRLDRGHVTSAEGYTDPAFGFGIASAGKLDEPDRADEAGRKGTRFLPGQQQHRATTVIRCKGNEEAAAYRSAGRFRGELYCGFAERHPHAPPALIAELGEILAGSPVTYRHVFHDCAEHGYALLDRDIYNKRAADRDCELIFAVFRRRIY